MVRDHERRAETRIRPEGVRIEFPDLQPRLRDLSLSGASIEDPHPLPRGRMVRMQIWLSKDVGITLRAMIRWMNEGAGMGMEFLEISDADRARLRNFIAAAP